MSLAEWKNTFPTLEFELANNYVYKWTPENYLFVNLDTNPHTFCLPWYQISGRVILGGVWMRNHDFLFDHINQKIGIARANCSFNHSTSDHSELIPFNTTPTHNNSNPTNTTPTSNNSMSNTTKGEDPKKSDTTKNHFTIICVFFFLIVAVVVVITVVVRRRRRGNG